MESTALKPRVFVFLTRSHMLVGPECSPELPASELTRTWVLPKHQNLGQHHLLTPRPSSTQQPEQSFTSAVLAHRFYSQASVLLRKTRPSLHAYVLFTAPVTRPQVQCASLHSLGFTFLQAVFLDCSHWGLNPQSWLLLCPSFGRQLQILLYAVLSHDGPESSSANSERECYKHVRVKIY